MGAPGGARFLTVESCRQGTGEKADEKRGDEYQDSAWAGGCAHFAMPYFHTNDYSTSPILYIMKSMQSIISQPSISYQIERKREANSVI